MDEGRKRLEYIRNDPCVSITVLGGGTGTTHVTLRDRVTALEDDPQFEAIDRLARHYTGEPYPQRDGAG